MAKSKPAARLVPWSRRSVATVGLLLLGATLMSLPSRLTQPARDLWLSMISPAQRFVRSGVDWSRETNDRWQAWTADRDQLATTDQIAKLTVENERLRRALDLAAVDRVSATPASDAIPPLVVSDSVSARVLGRTAVAVLQGQAIISVGARQHVAADAPVIDVGADAGLAADGLALVGRRVWGKLTSVGPLTSCVRRVTDPGYRDLVEIAHRDGQRLSIAARGVLVGRGEKQCHVELVDATAPVETGDEVYTAGDQSPGGRLFYGTIARAEHAAGDAHWRLWLAPAIGDEWPATVAVLRSVVNPKRLAAAGIEK